MTACAPGPSFTTHASNFSFFRRSAAFADITTDSIPNCLKHSLKMVRVPSLRSTKAIRAAAFLVWGMGARAVPKPVSMGGWRFSLPDLFWPVKTGLAKVLGAFSRYKSVITNGGLTGYLRGLAKGATPVRHARLYRGAWADDGVCPYVRGSDPTQMDYDQRLKTMAPLVPPKPKELESA